MSTSPLQGGSAAGPAVDIGSAPVIEWVDLEELEHDPYPTYARLRAEAPIAWVPTIGKVLVTRYTDCHTVEKDQTVFSANVSSATVSRALGAQPMLRKDDPDHAVDRQAVNPVLRPRCVKDSWAPIFQRNARRYLDALEAIGPQDADLNRDYAAPLASQNLIDMLGLTGTGVDDMRRWSHSFIAGAGNLLDDPEVWSRCDTAQSEVDTLLAELIPFYRNHPDQSITSALATSGLPEESVAANVKLTIAGGMNEPQHMITSSVWALNNHRHLRRQPRAAAAFWSAVFDETVRWLSPIGMYPRETTQRTVLGGVEIPAHCPIGVVVGSANRDDDQFSHPDRWDPLREKKPHLAFGSGVHLCAGHWAARVAIGNIAVPMLYERFPSLTVDDSRQSACQGWVFRGLTSLPVTWK